MIAKRRFVSFLEDACGYTHWFTHRRPWLWLPFPVCPLASLSDRLDQRWGTGVWTDGEPEPLRLMVRQCGRCGSCREVTEMGLVGDVWYCHPSTSNGATCYQRETWLAS